MTQDERKLLSGISGKCSDGRVVYVIKNLTPQLQIMTYVIWCLFQGMVPEQCLLLVSNWIGVRHVIWMRQHTLPAETPLNEKEVLPFRTAKLRAKTSVDPPGLKVV